MADKPFSVEEALRILDKRIKKLERDIKELKALLSIDQKKSASMIMKHEEKESVLNKLKSMKTEIESLTGSYKTKDGRVNIRDKRIASVDEKLKQKEQIKDNIEKEAGGKLSNRRFNREREKLKRQIQKLKKKRGILTARPKLITNLKVRAKLLKELHSVKVEGRLEGRKQVQEEFEERAERYNDEAQEMYADKRFIGGTAKKFSSWVNTGKSAVLGQYIKFLEFKNGKLDGARALADKLKEKLKKIPRKIKDAITGVRTR